MQPNMLYFTLTLFFLLSGPSWASNPGGGGRKVESGGARTGDSGSGHGPNWGWGWGSSPGNGPGNGWGWGSSPGNGPKNGWGWGSSPGNGWGWGSSPKNGPGNGWGWGSSPGNGWGWGFGSGPPPSPESPPSPGVHRVGYESGIGSSGGSKRSQSASKDTNKKNALANKN
ncbi:glycine-rich cell wall structural protein 2-like [Camellia sinensis]|uniref:glycine-rich cell wall structural protein 2-like n=1 Tax=Camellia sinensis TaxID=4442 RepID=UPI0010360486|nr:glycine-rich cell wall structural protein 2-like [Camellia sinensis]